MGKRLAVRLIASVFLAGISVCLVWYGILANRILAKDAQFVKKHSSVDLFVEALHLKANLAYYEQMDPAAAARYDSMAIIGEPLMIEAWLSLAKAELLSGHREKAVQVAGAISPVISSITTWKWQELLLAYELRDDKYFTDCFNFILARIPDSAQEASTVALDFWGDWEAVLKHVAPENGAACLKVLVGAGQADLAFSVWKGIASTGKISDKKFVLRFCEFLLDAGRVKEAKSVWRDFAGEDANGVQNGGFEKEQSDVGFDWRLIRHPDVRVDRTMDAPYEGAYCLHIRFDGMKNVSFNHVQQIVPVTPGRTYRLTFAHKSANLTSDEGVFLFASGFKCQGEGFAVKSKPLTGTNRWEKEELEVPVPETCEAISIVVRRNESMRFDNKIAGDYWLDAVELK